MIYNANTLIGFISGNNKNISLKQRKMLLRQAKKNGLLLCYVSILENNSIKLTKDEAKAIKAEKNRQVEYGRTIDIIHNIFSSNNIDYAVIKACNKILHVPRDIDVFIHPSNRDKVLDCFRKNGFEYIQYSQTETSMLKGQIRVDFYTNICYLGIEFIGSEYILNSLETGEVFGKKFFDLNCDASFMILLIHSVFGHRTISLLDFLYLSLIRNHINFNKCRDYADEKGWSEVFNLFMQWFDGARMGEFCSLRYPYIFKTSFIFKCIRGINEYKLSIKTMPLLFLTFLQDKIIYLLKDTTFYTYIRGIKPLRNFVNNITAYTKKLRGDSKSFSER